MKELLEKYNVTFDMSNLPGSLESVTSAYINLVETTNAKREGLAQAESRVRNNWVEDSALVTQATKLVDDFLPVLLEAMEKNPPLSAALYSVIGRHLMDQIKSERDGYVQEALIGSRKMPEIPVDDLNNLRDLIDAVFTMCEKFNSLPVDYAVKTSTTTGKLLPVLPNKPQNKVRGSVQAAISKRTIWTIDGVVVNERPTGIRGLLKLDTVADIYEAFGAESKKTLTDGKVYTCKVNGKVLTFQVVGTDTVDLDSLNEDSVADDKTESPFGND